MTATLHSDLTRIQDPGLPLTAFGVDLVSNVRNEGRLLPAFFDYYRALGVERFFIVDNMSNDGGFEWLQAQPDVTLFRTAAAYGDAGNGMDWVNSITDTLLSDRWVLHVDTDELLVYPGVEICPIPVLTRVLHEEGAEGIFAPMIDCYDDQLFAQSVYQAGTDFRQAAPFLDKEGYSARQMPPGFCPGLSVKGGMRARVFDFPAPLQTPVLRKVPLLRPNCRSPWETVHKLKPHKLSGMTGVLLHYRFLGRDWSDMNDDVDAALRGDIAPYYQAYADQLKDRTNSFFDPDISVAYRDTAQLVGLGLMSWPKEVGVPQFEMLKTNTGRAARAEHFSALKEAREAAADAFVSQLGHALHLKARV